MSLIHHNSTQVNSLFYQRKGTSLFLVIIEIILLETAYKVLAIIINNRLQQPLIEQLDHEAQCDFRQGRGCTDTIFTIKVALKKRREHNLETWVLFLDLVKASFLES